MLNNHQAVNNNRNILKYTLIVLIAISIISDRLQNHAAQLGIEKSNQSSAKLTSAVDELFTFDFLVFCINLICFHVHVGANCAFHFRDYHLCKKEWLLDSDPNFAKQLFYWLNSVLIAFVLMLVARSLETLGYL